MADRVWRCKFCETVNSPSASTCRNCELAKPGGRGGGGGGAAAAVSPSKKEEAFEWFDGT